MCASAISAVSIGEGAGVRENVVFWREGACRTRLQSDKLRKRYASAKEGGPNNHSADGGLPRCKRYVVGEVSAFGHELRMPGHQLVLLGDKRPSLFLHAVNARDLFLLARVLRHDVTVADVCRRVDSGR